LKETLYHVTYLQWTRPLRSIATTVSKKNLILLSAVESVACLGVQIVALELIILRTEKKQEETGAEKNENRLLFPVSLPLIFTCMAIFSLHLTI